MFQILYIYICSIFRRDSNPLNLLRCLNIIFETLNKSLFSIAHSILVEHQGPPCPLRMHVHPSAPRSV